MQDIQTTRRNTGYRMNRDRKQESRVKNKQSRNKNNKIPMTNRKDSPTSVDYKYTGE